MTHVFQYNAKTHRNFKWKIIRSHKGAERGMKCENPADSDIYIKDLSFTERDLKIYLTLYL